MCRPPGGEHGANLGPHHLGEFCPCSCPTALPATSGQSARLVLALQRAAASGEAASYSTVRVLSAERAVCCWGVRAWTYTWAQRGQGVNLALLALLAPGWAWTTTHAFRFLGGLA